MFAVAGGGPRLLRGERQHFCGYKLVLLVTADGWLLNFVLLPTDTDERVALDELLPQYRALANYGDKGFLDQARQAELAGRYGHHLYTPARTNH